MAHESYDPADRWEDESDPTELRRAVKTLESRLDGLKNDAGYWELRRTYGDHSVEVLRHLESCASDQGIA